MIKAAIIDDETHCIESLALHLEDLFPEIDLVYKSNKVHRAANELNDIAIDLLFLDIEMPGMNGFELLEHFPDRNFDVIFTTAYSQYAVKAFKTKAINYLLKPIDEEELKEAISTWKKEVRDKNNSSQKFEDLIDHLKKEGFMKSKISVPVSDGYEFIEVNDVMYCSGQSNYTKISLLNKKEILISKTMKEVERALKQFFFIRTHQSYLINPNFMKKFSRNDGGYVIMHDEKKIPVSQVNRKLIINLFQAIRKEGSL